MRNVAAETGVDDAATAPPEPADLAEQLREVHDRLASIEMLETVIHSRLLDIHTLLFRGKGHARDTR